MIAHDAAPTSHVSPYGRIDIRYPGRKRVITALELAQSGDRMPDPAVYNYNPLADTWIMKEGV